MECLVSVSGGLMDGVGESRKEQEDRGSAYIKPWPRCLSAKQMTRPREGPSSRDKWSFYRNLIPLLALILWVKYAVS